MTDRFRCSAASRDLGEALHGTASQVRRWLLVEQPGGWGRDAVLESRLPGHTAVALRARARAFGVRLLLVRRHGRYTSTARTCFFAVTTSQVRRVERVTVDDPADLLDLDWTPLDDDEPVGGEPVHAPVYLVCTNGRHDPCCSEFGRPLARALASALPERVWESSHFGGDRFAGNLVCLPDGVYYGRVPPANAARLVHDLEDGRLNLEHYRGRSFLTFAAQAAEQFARAQLRVIGVHDVRVTSERPLSDGGVRVEMIVAGERLAADLALDVTEDPIVATCTAGRPLRPLRYRLSALERLA